MDTGPHRVLAVGVVLVAAHTWSMPAGQVWVMATVASVTGGGAMSLDVDNQRWFRRLDRWVPDEWLGNGGPLQHRGLLHWWGWPVVLDAEPVDYLHAVAAYLAGAAVHVLLHGEIHRVLLGQFQLPSCHRSRLPFHLAHTCPGGTR